MCGQPCAATRLGDSAHAFKKQVTIMLEIPPRRAIFQKRRRGPTPTITEVVLVTNQIFKVVERLICKLFLPQRQLANGFGERNSRTAFAKSCAML